MTISDIILKKIAEIVKRKPPQRFDWNDSLYEDVQFLTIDERGQLNEKITIIKKIGNFISNILLGETKETIIRTDEGIKRIDDNIKEIKGDCKSIWNILSKHGEDITGLKVHTAYGVQGSPTIPSERGKEILQKSGFNEIYLVALDTSFGGGIIKTTCYSRNDK